MSDLDDLLAVARLARSAQADIDATVGSPPGGVPRPGLGSGRLIRSGTALAWVLRQARPGLVIPDEDAGAWGGATALVSEGVGIGTPAAVFIEDGHASEAKLTQPDPLPKDRHDAPRRPRVLISYSHDSPEHMAQVLALADRLRRDGIDCRIDRYVMAPRQGWPRWMLDEIEDADFVLMVCTQTYNRRFRGREEQGKGLGASWEGAIISIEIYNDQGRSEKFIPVILRSEGKDHVPRLLQGHDRYLVTDEADYEKLYRRLTGQHDVIMPELGELRALPPVTPKSSFESIDPTTQDG